jgi:hypothetical protein
VSQAKLGAGTVFVVPPSALSQLMQQLAAGQLKTGAGLLVIVGASEDAAHLARIAEVVKTLRVTA